ncbi:MAG: PQQ-binding-like beta-propeller repeat protein, partial [Pirellulales bacterium]
MQRPRRSSRLTVAAAVAIASFGAAFFFPRWPLPGGRLLAQVKAVPDAGVDPELAVDGVFLPPDRTAKRRLEAAQELLDKERYGEAVRLLGGLLENPEDFFYRPAPSEPVYRSLKAEASRLIAALPNAGRESYELEYGARARQMFKGALDRGDANELENVARQFFFTVAGQEATFLLGRHHLDHGRPAAAAMCFDRLRELGAASDRLEPALSLSLAMSWLRAAQPERARSALLRLKRSLPGAEVVVGGKPVRWFSDDAQATAWMGETFGPQESAPFDWSQQWALFRGNETRNGTSDGSRPLLNVRWRQRTTDDRLVEKFVSKVRQDYLSQDIVAMPGFHPLAVGDVVLMRTTFALQAVDFKTGKLVWRYAENDDSLDQFLKVGITPKPGRNAQILSGLDQRVWEDAVYGTLSSDGANVYYIQDLGLGVSGSPLRTVLPNGRHVMVNARSTNRLAARELRTQGKLRWEVGGVDGGDEPKLAGAFFLGPPLPLLGQLFALAEIRGQEIRLVVLSAETGALAWSQQLAVVDPPVTNDSYRRNAGAAPSFADGVLVCPTSAGAVVAVDLATRSLVWGYQYPRFQQETPDRFNAVRFAIYPGSERHANEHWADATITIADGKALVTPVESDQIYCLHLASGKELWKRDRGKSLYVACVHDGRVVLVGRDKVTSLNLSNGEPAGPGIELPSGSLPSGRGFYNGKEYFLPLSTAEVARIDLSAGQIVERARSHSGIVPGNLICFRDAIISQGAEYVDAYYQLDPLKREIAGKLAESPDDPQALAALAAVKLDENALGDAIELLERSYELNANESVREQLVGAMLDGLREDFDAHRERIDTLEELLERPEQRLTYLRLVAGGLQASGEIQPAFAAYLRLADEDAPTSLEEIDDVLSVDRHRWIRAQLDALRQMGSDGDRRDIDVEAQTRLSKALASDSTNVIAKFLELFADHPASAAARMALVKRLDKKHLVQCEALVRQIETKSSPADAVAARAHLARLLMDAGRIDLAARCYDVLAGRLADVAGADGKTGRQIVAELAPDSPVAKVRDLAGPWPQGKVEARETTLSSPPNSRRKSIDLDLVGATNPFFGELKLSLDLQTQVLLGRNGLGREELRIPIHEQDGEPAALRRFTVYNAPPLSSVTVHGGVLVLALRNQVVAIDGLGGGSPADDGILWTHDLGDQIGSFQTNQGVYSRPIPVPWGGTRQVPEDTYGRRYGEIGPVHDGGVAFQRLRDLHCVDPLSGKTLWLRKNVGLGHQLFGDGELLFVAPAGQEDTLVLRAATGEELGVRSLPPFEQRMLTSGRNVLCWEPHGAGHTLTMRDPWAEE